ncbi:MAG TPA: tetratricopeptide repeat protein [Pirellulales bacterium]
MKRTSLAPTNWFHTVGCLAVAGALVSAGAGCKSAANPNAGMPGLTQAPIPPAETPKKSYNPLTWFKKSPKPVDPGFTSMNQALPEPSDKQKLGVQIAMAQEAEQAGNVQEAIKVYQDALSQDPTRADVQVRLAVCHDRLGEFAESKQFYAAALKNSPNNPDIYCDMGYSNYLQRNWADSERNYHNALKIDPKHTRTLNNMGLLFARTERVEEALTAFRKGGCNEVDARSNVAVAMTLEENFEGARDQYMLAMKADPNSEVAREGMEMTEKLLAKATGKASETGSSVNAMVDRQRKPKAITPIVAKPSDKTDPLLASMAGTIPRPAASNGTSLPVSKPAAPKHSISDLPATTASKPQSLAAPNAVASAARAPAASGVQNTRVMRIPAVDEGAAAPVVQTSQQYPSTDARPAATGVLQAKDEVELDFVEGSLQRDRYSNEVSE